MKKTVLVFIFLLSCVSYACGPFCPQSYLRDEYYQFHGEEYQTYVNKRYGLMLLGKHFYPESLNQHFPKHVSDRDKVLKNEIMEIAKQAKIDPKISEQTFNDLQAIHQDIINKKEPHHNKYDDNFKQLFWYERGLYEATENPEAIPPESWNMILRETGYSYRTTWVLYMLGNLTVTKDPEKAYSYYHKLREAVKNGYKDSLGLAYDSFRAEYVYTSDICEKLKKALYCYSVYTNIGELEDAEKVFLDMKEIFRQLAKKENEKQKHELITDAVCREIVLLFDGDFIINNVDIEEFGPDKFQCADMLAFYAYKRGDRNLCMEYLKLAPETSMIKLWLLGRFARLDGNYKMASDYLRKWLDLYESSTDNPLIFSDGIFEPSMKDDILNTLGGVKVDDGDFSEAIYTFLKAGNKDDAMYVAEKIIKLDELKRFCENHDYLYMDRILARRLMRDWKVKEAAKYFGPCKALDFYCKWSEEANNISYTRNQRAEAFLKIGILLAHKRIGKTLFGTYFYPDYTDENGYRFYSNSGRNIDDKNILPCEYIFAAFFDRAASLAEDQDLKILSLYLGGSVLKHWFPKSADVYYKMICDCRPHPFAEETFKTRWFPKELSGDLEALKNKIEKSIGFVDFDVKNEETENISVKEGND